MPTLAQLKAKYLITAVDVPGGTRVPRAFDGSVAMQLVDGTEYFTEFFNSVKSLTGKEVTVGTKKYRDFVYIANWNFDAGMSFPNPRDPNLIDLLQVLAIKAQEGVDVRVLIWLGAWSVPDLQSGFFRWVFSSPTQTAQSLQVPHRHIAAANLNSARWLRAVDALKSNVLLDFGAHMFGAHHMKVATVYDATKDKLVSFCGGLDFARSRAGDVGHNTGSPLVPPPTATDASKGTIALATPSLSAGAAGTLPAGDYEARWGAVAVAANGEGTLFGLSPVASVTLPSTGSLAVAGVPVVPTPIGAVAVARFVFARPLGQNVLHRLAAAITAPNTTGTVDGPMSGWGKELLGWEWHDVAVKLEGEAAGAVTSMIRARWNNAANYPSLKLFDPNTPKQTGEANPKTAPATLPAPTVTPAAGGVLPAGDYEVRYSLAAELGVVKFFFMSDAATATVDANSKIDVAGLLTAHTYALSARPAAPSGDPLTAKDRVLWARRKDEPPTLRRVATLPAGVSSVTINTNPSSWTVPFPDADFIAKPIPDLNDSVKVPVPPPTGTQSIQVLATIADVEGLLSWLSGTTQKYSFAPDGEFTTYYGYKKAIAAATKYIYIEDQVMGPAPLIMGLIADRMTGAGAPADLKVLLVTSGAFDPADGDVDVGAKQGWNEGIYDALISELPSALQGNVKLFRSRGITAHSKVMLIDDEWAAVGSANIFDRSFSTDTELQTVVIDEIGMFPRQLRKTLWAEHLSIATADAAYSMLDDIDMGLYMWNSGWGTSPGVAFPAVRRAVEIPLPIPNISYPLPLSPDWVKRKIENWTTASF